VFYYLNEKETRIEYKDNDVITCSSEPVTSSRAIPSIAFAWPRRQIVYFKSLQWRKQMVPCQRTQPVTSQVGHTAASFRHFKWKVILNFRMA